VINKMRPGSEFAPYISKVREQFRMATPFRLGAEVASRGEYIISPYYPGSYADKNYRDGLEFGRRQREKEGLT
jgi:hypothetical protein